MTSKPIKASELKDKLDRIPAIWRRKHTPANELKLKLVLKGWLTN